MIQLTGLQKHQNGGLQIIHIFLDNFDYMINLSANMVKIVLKYCILLEFLYFGISARLQLEQCTAQDECTPATKTLFVGANGMTTTPNRTLFFVADPVERRVGVFNRTEEGFLDLLQFVDLPFGVDNIEYDDSSGIIINVWIFSEKQITKHCFCVVWTR